MDKYYIVAKINSEVKNLNLEKERVVLNSPKLKKIPDPSPKTMKRNKSRENFIKFQWSWTL